MILTYIKLAWRNVLRNKRRSFIAGTAIGIGLASLIFTDALMIGMKDNMVHSATATYLGEGQIHREGFRKTGEVEDMIEKPSLVMENLEKEDIIQYYAPRVMAFGMITSAANMNAATVVGVDPARERHLSQIDESIREGTFFEGEQERDILIGSKLAEILEAGLNDRIVLTVSQARSGDLSQEMFRVSGIFHLNIREMDRDMVFIRIHKAQEMLAIGENIHEIAMRFTGTQMGQNEELPLWKKYSQYGNEALSWVKLLPELDAALGLTDFSIFIISLILFGVVALGIINTLFMSLHERMFEFGVLRAVGTRPFGIAQMIFFEAGCLAIISTGIGIVLGFCISFIASRTGIDYTGIEFAGVTFRKLIYPIIKVQQYFYYPCWVFIFTLIAAIYPALFAARLTPAKAMRKSL